MNEMDLLYGMTAPGNLVVVAGLLALFAFAGAGLRVLSANQSIETFADQELREHSAAAVHIYKGGWVGLNSAGYARALVAGDRCLGLCEKECDNSAGSAGDLRVKCRTLGDVVFTLTSVAVTDIGKHVFASADDTLTFTEAGNSYVGWVVGVDATNKAIIRLDIDVPRGPIVKAIEIDCTAAGNTTIIPAAMNEIGLAIKSIQAIVSERFAGAGQDQGIIAFKNSSLTALNVTLRPSDGGADALKDVIPCSGTKYTLEDATIGQLGVILSAGVGLVATCSQVTSGAGAAGKMIVCVEAIPIKYP